MTAIFDSSQHSGIMVGCWDFEKTSPLIKELEHTVSVAEKKCGDLMEQINYYKGFCKQWGSPEVENQRLFKKRSKRKLKVSRNRSSSSEGSHKTKELSMKMYKKISSKIAEVNDEISQANRKMGLSQTTFVLEPSVSEERTAKIENAVKKYLEPEKEIQMATKSDSAIETEKEIKVMQKLSKKSLPEKKIVKYKQSLSAGYKTHRQRYRLRKIEPPSGKKRKFGFGGFVEIDSDTADFKEVVVEVPKVSKLALKSPSFKTRRGFNSIERCSSSSLHQQNPTKMETKSQPNLTKITKLSVANDNLMLPERKPIPFTICKSTSRSFNIGMNIQQVLSLMKQRRPNHALQGLVQENLRTTQSVIETSAPSALLNRPVTRYHPQCCPAKCGVPTVVEEELARPEDAWVVKELDATPSRCTCYPSKHCIDYHKVLQQYTASRSGSVSLPNIPNPSLRDPSGACKLEFAKIQSDLMSLQRRYLDLEEHVVDETMEVHEAVAEVETLELELHEREKEYKEVVQVYDELLSLKFKVEQLRQQLPKRDCHRTATRHSLKPTSSMNLTKVLRHIQSLQDQIKIDGR